MCVLVAAMAFSTWYQMDVTARRNIERLNTENQAHSLDFGAHSFSKYLSATTQMSRQIATTILLTPRMRTADLSDFSVMETEVRVQRHDLKLMCPSQDQVMFRARSSHGSVFMSELSLERSQCISQSSFLLLSQGMKAPPPFGCLMANSLCGLQLVGFCNYRPPIYNLEPDSAVPFFNFAACHLLSSLSSGRF